MAAVVLPAAAVALVSMLSWIPAAVLAAAADVPMLATWTVALVGAGAAIAAAVGGALGARAAVATAGALLGQSPALYICAQLALSEPLLTVHTRCGTGLAGLPFVLAIAIGLGATVGAILGGLSEGFARTRVAHASAVLVVVGAGVIVGRASARALAFPDPDDWRELHRATLLLPPMEDVQAHGMVTDVWIHDLASTLSAPWGWIAAAAAGLLAALACLGWCGRAQRALVRLASARDGRVDETGHISFADDRFPTCAWAARPLRPGPVVAWASSTDLVGYRHAGSPMAPTRALAGTRHGLRARLERQVVLARAMALAAPLVTSTPLLAAAAAGLL